MAYSIISNSLDRILLGSQYTYQKVSERYNYQKVYAEMATNHKSFVSQEIRRHSSILDLFKGVYSNLDTADIAKLKTAKSSNTSATSARSLY